MLEDGLLLDARLSQLRPDEVTRQHFQIPVTVSDGVVTLMQQNYPSDEPMTKRIWGTPSIICSANSPAS